MLHPLAESNPMSTTVNPLKKDVVFTILHLPQSTDWLTLDVIAFKAFITKNEAQAILDELVDEGKVRHPVNARSHEEHLYRASNRGLTRGERLRTLRDAVTRR